MGKLRVAVFQQVLSMESGTLTLWKFLWRCVFYSSCIIVLALAEEHVSIKGWNMFLNKVLVQNSSTLVKCIYSWKKVHYAFHLRLSGHPAEWLCHWAGRIWMWERTKYHHVYIYSMRKKWSWWSIFSNSEAVCFQKILMWWDGSRNLVVKKCFILLLWESDVAKMC